MNLSPDEIPAVRQTFKRLFDNRPAQVALLDLDGEILEVNRSWRSWGKQNGMPDTYDCVGQNYLLACETAARHQVPGADEVFVGLLEVFHAHRAKFTAIYPCHTPVMQRWYRLWAQPQMPQIPAVIVAHYEVVNPVQISKATQASLSRNYGYKQATQSNSQFFAQCDTGGRSATWITHLKTMDPIQIAAR